MSPQFVPFGNSPSPASGAAGNDPIRLKVISSPDAPAPVINAPAAASPGSKPASTAFAPMGGAHVHQGQPKVTAEKEGDRITKIRIQCTCGQVIELDCQY